LRNCAVVGNVDINEDRFITEYTKTFLNRWPDFKHKNQEGYIHAQAKK